VDLSKEGHPYIYNIYTKSKYMHNYSPKVKKKLDGELNWTLNQLSWKRASHMLSNS